ncbi:hypothetical protein GQX74_004290 [Glossina fuscipes]|nr:hypothetical protein GQX74_004290 [Glossina fuscipes]
MNLPILHNDIQFKASLDSSSEEIEEEEELEEESKGEGNCSFVSTLLPSGLSITNAKMWLDRFLIVLRLSFSCGVNGDLSRFKLCDKLKNEIYDPYLLFLCSLHSDYANVALLMWTRPGIPVVSRQFAMLTSVDQTSYCHFDDPIIPASKLPECMPIRISTSRFLTVL